MSVPPGLSGSGVLDGPDAERAEEAVEGEELPEPGGEGVPERRPVKLLPEQPLDHHGERLRAGGKLRARKEEGGLKVSD